MTLFTEEQLKKIANETRGYEEAATLLKDEAASVADETSFDVFLSHPFKDAEIVLGVKRVLEKNGFSVYADWTEDHHPSRTMITVIAADLLRVLMKQSKCLIYMHSDSSVASKWMPWELGHFDGLKGIVAILPVVRLPSLSFNGKDFLGLYPYIDASGSSLFINQGNSPPYRLGTLQEGKNFKHFREWMKELAGVK